MKQERMYLKSSFRRYIQCTVLLGQKRDKLETHYLIYLRYMTALSIKLLKDIK